MSDQTAGFSPKGSVVIHTCTNADIHNPVNWPGVIVADPHSNFWLKNGQIYDPETDGMTAFELEQMSIDLDEIPELCLVCGAPAEELCVDCR